MLAVTPRSSPHQRTWSRAWPAPSVYCKFTANSVLKLLDAAWQPVHGCWLTRARSTHLGGDGGSRPSRLLSRRVHDAGQVDVLQAGLGAQRGQRGGHVPAAGRHQGCCARWARLGMHDGLGRGSAGTLACMHGPMLGGKLWAVSGGPCLLSHRVSAHRTWQLPSACLAGCPDHGPRGWGWTPCAAAGGQRVQCGSMLTPA